MRFYERQTMYNFEKLPGEFGSYSPGNLHVTK